MALSTKIALRGCLWKQNGGLRWLPSISGMATMKPMTPAEHLNSREEFWNKNKRLSRPISPHMTIYKPQVTSMLSITHRGTGLAQSGILSMFGVGAIVSSSSFPVMLDTLQSMQFGTPLIFLAKFAIAWPMTFHLFNGCRHLFWDMGYGFELPDLYKTGYAVLALSIVTGLALAAM